MLGVAKGRELDVAMTICDVEALRVLHAVAGTELPPVTTTSISSSVVTHQPGLEP
jgi:hypothetical protein